MAHGNDNDAGAPPAEVQGQAALLLAESLMHMLIERGLLSASHAIEVLDGATETTTEIRVNGFPRRDISPASTRYLDAIRASLERG